MFIDLILQNVELEIDRQLLVIKRSEVEVISRRLAKRQETLLQLQSKRGSDSDSDESDEGKLVFVL